MILNPKNIKKDFPIFKLHDDLVYLDNAATMQTPTQVVEAIKDYYTKYNANIHRGVHRLSILATEMVARSRRVVAEFINAEEDEVIFNSGATIGLNTIAFGLAKNITSKDNIVLTRMEHHANLVPWQQVAKMTGCEIRYIEITDSYHLDMESAYTLIDQNTKVVSMIHVSNVLGTVVPIKELIKLASEVGAYSVIDAAQSIPHMKIDVKELDCDFLVFSGHKIIGPTGVGVMYGKKHLLDAMEPFVYGGDMIKKVTYETSEWNEVPNKFEAGTPDIAGITGLAAALVYVKDIGRDNINKHEAQLREYAISKLEKIDGLKIIGPKHDGVSLISFTVKGIHSYDFGILLDQQNIAVRTGYHCAEPLMRLLDVEGTVRASFAFYNSNEDIDLLVDAIKKSVVLIDMYE